MHLFEKTVSSDLIFDGKIITVKKDTAELENGEIVNRELVVHPGGVCIVPINDKGEILMVKQFRYPFQTVLTEIPAGKLEVGEDHREAGLRELREETGAVCEKFEYLGVCYPSVAYLTEKIHMYMATGLTFEKQDLDEDEFLDVVKIKMEDAVKMIMNGEIEDAKTQCAILKAAILLGKAVVQ
ncbi:MAG: NUDIX hydrolase [Oscillospiraceae bacterium]|nr:NUDIX hydrolase [Oscillospiraceae bacterium]